MTGCNGANHATRNARRTAYRKCNVYSAQHATCETTACGIQHAACSTQVASCNGPACAAALNWHGPLIPTQTEPYSRSCLLQTGSSAHRLAQSRHSVAGVGFSSRIPCA